jgi:hypothetical protein
MSKNYFAACHFVTLLAATVLPGAVALEARAEHGLIVQKAIHRETD